MDTQQPDSASAPETDPTSSAISRGIVGIYANHYGRGPTRARSYIHDEYVMTILEDSFTVGDRTLLRAGKLRQVEETRRAFREAVRDQFIGVIESATGREVDVFMSQIDATSETVVEVFLMKSSPAR